MKRQWKLYKYTYKLHYKVEVNMCTGNFRILATPETHLLPYMEVSELRNFHLRQLLGSEV